MRDRAGKVAPTSSLKNSIARKEARETHFGLRILAASSIIPKSRLRELIHGAGKLIAILTAIIKKAMAKAQ